MRVALLALNACAGDAIGNQLAGKVRFFLERGWEVRLFVESLERLHPELSMVAHRTSAAKLWTDPVQRRFLTEADLVLAEFGVAFSLLHLMPALPEPRPRILFEYHGLTPTQLWEPAERWRLDGAQQDRGLAWCADRVLVKSRFTQRELHEATGIPMERFTSLPGFVELQEPATRTHDVKAELGLSDAQVLLFVGRLARNKRAPLLVETIARLKDDVPPVHAVLIGVATDAYAAEAEHCRERADKLDVSDRVHVLGQVHGDVLQAWYAAADVLVMPSLHEGFCLPVIEAMAAGLPVVTARAAALPETLGSSGLSFTPEDVDDLVRQLRRVLDGSEQPRRPATGRIAIVGPRFGGNFAGGAERSLERIATAIRAAGKEATLFALKTTVEALVAELVERQEEFDAIIVGPAIHEVAQGVALRLPAKTVLLPCFHDEPQARSPELLAACRGVSAMLYHTPEEQAFADAELGVNHPHSAVIGTWIDAEPGNAERGRQRCGERYVVYCGRYCREKGFDLLLDWMRRWHAARPGSLRLVVMGENQAHLPREPWLLDLGFISEQLKRDVLAGAGALIQLSINESLSLVALEAWAQGVPVIAQRACAVLHGQIERSCGGLTVTDWDDFAAALDSLRTEPELWRQRGTNGQAYVRRHYQSEATFANAILDLLTERSESLGKTLARKGKQRAAGFSRANLEERFAAIIDEVLALPAVSSSTELRIYPQVAELRAEVGSERVLLPLRVMNVGQWPAAARGPASMKLNVRVRDQVLATTLPMHLLPGATQLVVVPVPVPESPGNHAVEISVTHPEHIRCTCPPLMLEVVPVGHSAASNGLVENVRQTVARLQGQQTLPDDYQDITHGPVAGLKRRIKQKLLHNFRTAYVDVLARQQSQFNAQVVTALCQLADCSAAAGQPPVDGDVAKTHLLLRKTLRGQRRLERRLARLEQSFEALARSCP